MSEYIQVVDMTKRDAVVHDAKATGHRIFAACNGRYMTGAVRTKDPVSCQRCLARKETGR